MAVPSANNSGPSVLRSRLEVQLRCQSRWIATGLGIGVPLCILGMLLGVLSILAGLPSGSWNFITRGIAWIAMSGVLTFGLLQLLEVQSGRTAGALLDLVDLAIGRMQKTLGLIKAGLGACAFPVVSWLVSIAFRSHFGRPPRLSPILALEILVLIALVLVVGAWRLKVGLRKYRILRQALAVGRHA